MLRRFFRVEAQLWEHASMEAQLGTGVELGESFFKDSPIFMRLQRRITAAERAAEKAKAELQRLKLAAQAQQTTTETPQMGSFLKPTLSDPPTDFEVAQLDLYIRQQMANAGLKPVTAADMDS